MEEKLLMKNDMDINRIKIVLAERKRTNRWLAKRLQKSEETVSRWCNNKLQPSIENLFQIAEALNVDVRDLLHSTKHTDS